jgi:KDO2-lipid IV(A) lauroyltransferase
LALSFTRFKDRIWGGFDASLRALAGMPGWVQTLAYGPLQGLFLVAYLLPGTPLAKTSRDFAALLGRRDAFAMYRQFARQFAFGLQRMEMLRSGQAQALGAMLDIPRADLIDRALSEGKGAVIAMPHCHASIAMVRGLAARYPVLMLVRESREGARAEAQRSYYDHLGCDCVDVRRTSDAAVARVVLKALRQGKLVVGVVDRIQAAPLAEEPYDKMRDMVRVDAFGQPVGWIGWPVRFAARLGSPILPAMVAQTPTRIVLHLSPPRRPEDLQTATQAIADDLATLIRAHPAEWVFLYDKHWRQVLDRARADPPQLT